MNVNCNYCPHQIYSGCSQIYFVPSQGLIISKHSRLVHSSNLPHLGHPLGFDESLLIQISQDSNDFFSEISNLKENWAAFWIFFNSFISYLLSNMTAFISFQAMLPSNF